MPGSRESIEASIILSATSEEEEEGERPFLSLSPHPIGKGVCLTVTNSSCDSSSLSEHSQHYFSVGNGSERTITPSPTPSLRHNKQMELILDAEGQPVFSSAEPETRGLSDLHREEMAANGHRHRGSSPWPEEEIYAAKGNAPDVAVMRVPGEKTTFHGGALTGVPGIANPGTSNGFPDIVTHATRRFPPQPLPIDDQLEQLLEYNKELQLQLAHALKGDLDAQRLINERIYYKQKVDELNSYIDQIDVEAEQEFGCLSSEVEEMNRLVDEKSRYILKIERDLFDRDQDIKKLNESLEAAKAANMRQKEIIENIRDDLDIQREKNDERNVAWERAVEEMDSLRRRITQEKEEHRRKELLFSVELDEVQRQLDRQKEIVESGSLSELLKKWDDRILRNEYDIRERDSIIFTQQDIMKKLQREISTLQRGSPPMSTLGRP